MKVVMPDNSRNNIKDAFLREKSRLKEIIYSEIEKVEKGSIDNSLNYSTEMLKDALFVIERGFEDITSNLNEFNIKEKEAKLVQFEESLIYALYGS